ncbi:hypothetical protein NHX12_030606, partial [Muraenolepis orangiensis]
MLQRLYTFKYICLTACKRPGSLELGRRYLSSWLRQRSVSEAPSRPSPGPDSSIGPGEDAERTRRGPGEDPERTRRGPGEDPERTRRGPGAPVNPPPGPCLLVSHRRRRPVPGRSPPPPSSGTTLTLLVLLRGGCLS